METAKRTLLEVTTQHSQRSEDPTLSWNYSTNDNMLWYKHINEHFFMDTFFATKKASKTSLGNNCMQLCCGQQRLFLYCCDVIKRRCSTCHESICKGNWCSWCSHMRCSRWANITWSEAFLSANWNNPACAWRNKILGQIELRSSLALSRKQCKKTWRTQTVFLPSGSTALKAVLMWRTWRQEAFSSLMVRMLISQCWRRRRYFRPVPIWLVLLVLFPRG